MAGDAAGPDAAAAAAAVWLDCDPGHDDAMAILLAGHCGRMKLLGVSTVASNQVVEKTCRNALDVLDWVGLSHIGVVKGQAGPLMREAVLCPEIHGESGLDGPHGGPVLPHSTRQPLPGKAPIVMAAAIQAQHAAHPDAGRVQLICTGALTNAALLLLLFPELKPLLEVTIMGGAMGVGNTGPVQEFNIQVDPEAAKIVFESGVPLTMVPLEVTHTVLVTPAVLQRIVSRQQQQQQQQPEETGILGADAGAGAAAGGQAPPPPPPPGVSPFRAMVEVLLTFFQTTYREVFRFHDGAPLHDPLAVAAVLAPQLFEFELMRVDIETSSKLCAGQTVCDVWRTSKLPPNCRVAKAVDVEGFWRLMLAAIDAADAAAPMNREWRLRQQQGALSEAAGA